MASFKEKVLAVVSRIPKGSVMTYKEVAARAGSSGAYRAVGSIMAQNVDPSVPCHRVVRSDGGIGEYNRGGVSQKKQLLQNEGVRVDGERVGRIFQRHIMDVWRVGPGNRIHE